MQRQVHTLILERSRETRSSLQLLFESDSCADSMPGVGGPTAADVGLLTSGGRNIEQGAAARRRGLCAVKYNWTRCRTRSFYVP